jgi:hypothetical protein
MEPTMTRIDTNREIVALITAIEALQDRVSELPRNGTARGNAEDHLWNANDRLADVRTNLELALHFNR